MPQDRARVCEEGRDATVDCRVVDGLDFCIQIGRRCMEDGVRGARGNERDAHHEVFHIYLPEAVQSSGICPCRAVDPVHFLYKRRARAAGPARVRVAYISRRLYIASLIYR